VWDEICAQVEQEMATRSREARDDGEEVCRS
jgi:hypothetical protein